MIPRHFHFIFGLKPQNEPFHLAYYLCLKSCLEINQPNKLSFYYHHEPYGEYWDMIKRLLSLEKVEPELFVRDHAAYFEHQEGQFIKGWQLDYAHQADFIRLKKLIEHGGVYADMDTLFVAPIPDELYQHAFVIGREKEVAIPGGQEDVPSLCNALMMAEQGTEFARQWLKQSYEVFNGTWSKHSCQLAAVVAEQIPQSVTIIPQVHFFKHIWTVEGIHTLFEGLDSDFSQVYSMHMWNHLWWDAGRTDFSSFHEGLLTEDYIRNVDTTYNIIARQYLP